VFQLILALFFVDVTKRSMISRFSMGARLFQVRLPRLFRFFYSLSGGEATFSGLP
jgi:hypothetical protein